MKERPILFSGPMVRAILAGTKTQTRRVVKPEIILREIGDGIETNRPCPHGQPGDRLWVRETHALISYDVTGVGIYPVHDDWQCIYGADQPREFWDGGWRPSIHMPRWASRINLEITNVRVERLQEISEEDSLAEGITHALNDSLTAGWGDPPTIPTQNGVRLYRLANGFKQLWDSINGGNLNHGGGPNAWAQNPWVWVIEFKVLTPQHIRTTRVSRSTNDQSISESSSKKSEAQARHDGSQRIR